MATELLYGLLIKDWLVKYQQTTFLSEALVWLKAVDVVDLWDKEQWPIGNEFTLPKNIVIVAHFDMTDVASGRKTIEELYNQLVAARGY